MDQQKVHPDGGQSLEDHNVSADTLDPRTIVADIAERKIRAFLGTIDENGTYLSKVYAGNASLSEAITADYHGRFLIELVQNANDVHPREGTDGEIKIVLDPTAGPSGTLYIANKGNGFSEENLNALCDMGLSSKPPGESIGNKGLGFRSVYHITDTPLIFSQAHPVRAKPRFDGYCFGFAQYTELKILIPDERRLELADRDLPLFHVPVWLEEQSSDIVQFARDGFATVIAPPLRDKKAKEAVEQELERLRDQKAPLLLFLTRLRRLLAIVPAATQIELTRHETVLAEKPSISIADLGNTGRYLIARAAVEESTMLDAIREGVASHQLHKHWMDWRGNGEVGLAVRLDADASAPRLYTFLPMGIHAQAPFSGYLHGSFFPDSSRTGLDASIRLNELLLERAASLAAQAVVYLVGQTREELSPGDVAIAAADLLAWKEVDSLSGCTADLAAEVAEGVALAMGAESFDRAACVPCAVATGGQEGIQWRPPAEARLWPEGFTELGEVRASELSGNEGVAPIWRGLGLRAERLHNFLFDQADGYCGAPSGPERAAFAEKVASALAAPRKFEPSAWSKFYFELSRFLHQGGLYLSGRKVLLCADGELRAGTINLTLANLPSSRRKRAPRSMSIFSPPGRLGGKNGKFDELSPPSELKDQFAFLTDKLDWYGDLADARTFFENMKLVSSFDRETVLNQLSQILALDTRNASRAAGLRWAFQIWRNANESGRPARIQRQHRFYVPNITGDFIEARDAVFSEGWPEETLGRLLQRFIATAPDECEDINDFAGRRLAAPSHYAFKIGTTELWTRFLTELGVQRGLTPIAKKVEGSVSAHRVRTFDFCSGVGIPPDWAATWKADILENAGPRALSLHTTTNYIIKGPLWWLPGQGDVQRFSENCAEAFAMLIISWFRTESSVEWEIEVHHCHNHKSDRRNWPTPFAAFLRSGAWIPTVSPGSASSTPLRCRPAEVWIAAAKGERFPQFLRRPITPLMRELERAGEEQINALRDRAQLRVLHDQRTLGHQAEFLASQYRSPNFEPYFERHLLNLYNQTWSAYADRLSANLDETIVPVAPQFLIVRKGAEAVAVSVDGSHESVVVRDTPDETALSLIEASGRPYLDTRSTNLALVGSLFRKLYGNKIRLLSETTYEMHADGEEVGTRDTDLLGSRIPVMRMLVAVAIEGLKGAESQRLPADRSLILAKFDRLLLQTAKTIEFRVDGAEIAGGIGSRSAFALKLDSGEPIIVVRCQYELTWEQLDGALGAICESIEHPSLESNLRLLVLNLRTEISAPHTPPPQDLTIERLCSFLRLGDGAANAARETLGDRIERYVPWLRALVHMGGGNAALDAFDEDHSEIIRDAEHLRAAVQPSLTAIGLDAAVVLDVCKRCLTIKDLREDLDLNFAALNSSLMAVGELPDTYPELHKSLLANYIHENEIALIESLREASSVKLRANQPAPEYRSAREELRSLMPDPSWLHVHQDIPEVVLRNYLNLWLSKHGASPLGQTLQKLEPLDKVRSANAELLRKFVKEASPLVRVWVSKNSHPFPSQWRNPDEDFSSLRASLDESGVFDFQRLDRAELLDWLLALDVWPREMPLTLDLNELGLTVADLDADQRKAREAADAKMKEARSVRFNGRDIDPQEADWLEIAKELEDSLSKKMMQTPVGATAKLLPANRGSGGGGRGTKGGKNLAGGSSRAPSEKTDMIGRLGELAVYKWLREKLPGQNIDAAWRSCNCTAFTGRNGSDSLGFDFEISYRNQPWQIEVKASLGDPCGFEMGETEVRAAQSATRSRPAVRYVIAYVSNVGDPGQAMVEILPNPLSEEGSALLQLLGQGIRYGFRRAVSKG